MRFCDLPRIPPVPGFVLFRVASIYRSTWDFSPKHFAVSLGLYTGTRSLAIHWPIIQGIREHATRGQEYHHEVL